MAYNPIWLGYPVPERCKLLENTFMRYFRILILLLACSILLAACAAPAPKPAPVQTAVRSSTPTIPQPTRTPLPSETPRPTFTATITDTPEPSATFTITPDPALTEIKWIGMSWYKNYDLLLSFQFPGPVTPEDYRVTLENKEYRCEVIAKHADRLYCRGPGAKVLAVATVRVYASGNAQPGFEKEIWIPFFDNDYSSFYE
jgi:hypothetical protein